MTAPWYNFLGLNLERLYAVRNPFDFRIYKRNSCFRIILVCWALALLPTVPMMFNTTIQHNWRGKSGCKCFFPIDDKIWVVWASVTNFLIPTLLILVIWVVMAHHFITTPTKFKSKIILKRATIKVVCITSLFLLNVLPFCVVFAAAAFKTPESTKWLDYTFFFPLFNGMVQPIVYILSFQRLREASIKMICCGRNRQGLDVF